MALELTQDIMLWGGIALGSYLFMVVTWVMYLAIMKLYKHKDNLYPIAKAHGYVLLAIGLIMDTILNVVIATILLLQLPREFLLTTRLKRNIYQGRGWRRTVSLWVCEHLLDQFDPNGKHC